jgi:hypothetical protein
VTTPREPTAARSFHADSELFGNAGARFVERRDRYNARMNGVRHLVWPFAALAWAALVLVLIAYAGWEWQHGIHRDADIQHFSELAWMLAFVFTLPMAALAFGVFAPLAIALDTILCGRTPRAINVVLCAILAAPALFVTVYVTGWPEHSVAQALGALRHLDRARGLVAGHVVAGAIVGLGLRHPRQQHSRDSLIRKWFIS